MDDRDLNELEYGLDDEDAEAFSAMRLLGVATVGAMLSLGAYYIYQNLEPSKRASLKKQASGLVAQQIHRLTELDED